MMKRERWILAAGLAASVALAGGCVKSAKAPQEQMEAAAQTEMQGQWEIRVPGQEKTTESQTEIQTEIGAGELSFPLRIWGEVREAGDQELTVENESQYSSPGEMILHIDPEKTVILDAAVGYPVELSEVEKERFVAYLGPAMTLSLPPQATPELVLVHLPEEGEAPDYVTAAEAPAKDGEGWVLTAESGETYPIAADAEVSPYLTRNRVTLDDIEKGSRCLLWLDGEGRAVRILLFAQ